MPEGHLKSILSIKGYPGNFIAPRLFQTYFMGESRIFQGPKKKFGSKKICGSKINVVSKKNLNKKEIVGKKNVGSKKNSDH